MLYELLKGFSQRFELTAPFALSYAEMTLSQRRVVGDILVHVNLQCDTLGYPWKRMMLKNKLVVCEEISRIFVGFGYCPDHRKIVLENCAVAAGDLDLYANSSAHRCGHDFGRLV